MDKTKEQLEKLREVTEASLTKTDELQKVLAQIEALMSRDESKTLSKKKIILGFVLLITPQKFHCSYQLGMQNPFQSFLLGLEVLPSLSKRPL